MRLSENGEDGKWFGLRLTSLARTRSTLANSHGSESERNAASSSFGLSIDLADEIAFLLDNREKFAERDSFREEISAEAISDITERVRVRSSRSRSMRGLRGLIGANRRGRERARTRAWGTGEMEGKREGKEEGKKARCKRRR